MRSCRDATRRRPEVLRRAIAGSVRPLIRSPTRSHSRSATSWRRSGADSTPCCSAARPAPSSRAATSSSLTTSWHCCAVQALTEVGPLSLVAAFRAAGITPGEHRISADEYVALLAHELLPDIADEELATLFTLAADHTALSLEQSWRVLCAAQTHGLRRRLELSATSHPGVVDFAEEMGVGSIVLLDAPSEDDLTRLAESQLTAIVSVGADGVATWGHQCARRLIELGVPLALGTGGGPMGGSPSTILEAIRFACNSLGLTPAEALIAATVNAAFASGMGDDVGPLEPGKRADLLILNTPSYSRLPYESSDDPIRAVEKDGRLMVDQGAPVA